MIESYASTKSFRPRDEERSQEPEQGEKSQDSNGFKPRNVEVNFHGQKRSNLTHASRTDPEAKLYRKSPGQEARLCHLGHALTENRHGLVMAVTVTEANGTAEETAALEMLDRLHQRLGKKPATLGSDKGFDSGPYYLELEARGIVPHSAMIETKPAQERHLRAGKRPAFEARCRMRERLLTEAYRLSQRCRKKVEECFGWIKTVAGLARSRHVGRWKLRQQMEIAAAAFNLVRMRKLLPT
jgi:hypothetical protein